MKDPLDHQTLDLVEATKRPLSPAERQKRRREKVRELKAAKGLRAVLLAEDELRLVEQLRDQKVALAPETVQAIALTQTDRMVLSLGLLAHEDLYHRPADWEASKKPGFDALLQKLWPEGDNGRYLAEPERSTRRPTAFLRDELDRQKTLVQRLEEQNRALRAGQSVVAEFSVAIDDPQNWSRTVRLTRDEDSLMAWAFSVYFTARADLEHLESPYVLERLERIFEGCPIWTDEFKAQLDQDRGIINGNKYRDKEAKRGWECYEKERKSLAATCRDLNNVREENTRLHERLQVLESQVGEASSPKMAAELNRLLDVVKELEERSGRMGAENYALKRENAMLESERNKAHKAIGTWENRLRAAGLSTDYRAQPGE